MNYIYKAKQLHENVNHSYDGYSQYTWGIFC